MKSKEFIVEDAMSSFARVIKKNCQPYLQEAEPFLLHNNLLRGLGGENKPVVKKSIRLEDRKPKDIPIELHNQVNQYFEQQYGASFRNALFTTSDYDQAENYGNVYCIFPIGEFKYLWSPNVEDLFILYDEYAPWFKVLDTTPEDIREKKRQFAMSEFFDQEIKNGKWFNTNLKQGIESGNEVMIRAAGYYAVNIEIIDADPTEFFRMIQ